MTLPAITSKQREILTLIYQSRFLNRNQIQTLLNHKDKKTINTWLKDLTQKEYLNRIYKTNFSENVKPAIYYMGINAIRLVKHQLDYSPSYIRSLYRDKERSESFIDQCLLLGDIRVQLHLKNKEGSSYSVLTPVNFEVHFPFIAELYPKLLIQDQDKYHLLDIFEQTLPRYSIRKRLKDYLEFYMSDLWADNNDVSFSKILFICPDKSMLIYAKRYTRYLLKDEDLINFHVNFATLDDLRKLGITGNIWETV